MKEREDEERRVFPIHSSNPAVCSFAVTSRGASLSSLSANEILPSFVVAEWKVEREEPKLSKQNLLLFFRESITEAPPSQSHARRTPLTFHPSRDDFVVPRGAGGGLTIHSLQERTICHFQW